MKISVYHTLQTISDSLAVIIIFSIILKVWIKILFLNNDAFLEKDTLYFLKKSMYENNNTGIVGPRILKYGTDGIIENDGAYVWPWFLQQKFIHAGERSDKYPAIRSFEVPFVSGACMLIRHDLFTKLDGFDNRFFAYFEDWDLCLRARESGYKCLHVSDAIVWHIGSRTSEKDSFIYHYLMTRNRYLMACKHVHPVILYSVFIPYFLLSRILFKTIILLFKGSLTGTKGIYFALAWILMPVRFKSRFWPLNLQEKK